MQPSEDSTVTENSKDNGEVDVIDHQDHVEVLAGEPVICDQDYQEHGGDAEETIVRIPVDIINEIGDRRCSDCKKTGSHREPFKTGKKLREFFCCSNRKCIYGTEGAPNVLAKQDWKKRGTVWKRKLCTECRKAALFFLKNGLVLKKERAPGGKKQVIDKCGHVRPW